MAIPGTGRENICVRWTKAIIDLFAPNDLGEIKGRGATRYDPVILEKMNELSEQIKRNQEQIVRSKREIVVAAAKYRSYETLLSQPERVQDTSYLVEQEVKPIIKQRADAAALAESRAQAEKKKREEVEEKEKLRQMMPEYLRSQGLGYYPLNMGAPNTHNPFLPRQHTMPPMHFATPAASQTNQEQVLSPEEIIVLSASVVNQFNEKVNKAGLTGPNNSEWKKRVLENILNGLQNDGFPKTSVDSVRQICYMELRDELSPKAKPQNPIPRAHTLAGLQTQPHVRRK